MDMKKFLVSFCITVLVSISLGITSINAQDVKIGLFFDMSKGSVDEKYNSFSVSSDEGLKVRKYVEQEVSEIECEKLNVNKMSSSGNIIVYWSDKDFLFIQKDNEYIEIEPKNGVFKINEDNSNMYRGNLILKKIEDDKFVLINKLELEKYLYGVVVREIGSYAPKEAIKAQAVSSRTYIISHLNMFSKYGFDITDSKYQQVYRGYSKEEEKVNLAVDETKGLVMFYDDKPIRAFYFSSSGGRTENSENVWTQKIPYLVSVQDKYEANRKESSEWTVKHTKEDIENLLKGKNIDIGELQDIRIVNRTESGRVLELQYVGSNGEYTYTKNEVRNLVGLRSQWFYIEKKENVYSFIGKGNGHGVGLSQVGAMGMADAGFNYIDILKHYFTGIEIREI